ncbi:uncharacterized protein METZ01_LOCUS293389 [marine metagenome]|uniref:Uncharacterized protein n=1 Tax=marine metagenome TaxID=408172 RepID=A0A382LXU5_9ZZZZ
MVVIEIINQHQKHYSVKKIKLKLCGALAAMINLTQVHGY